MADQTPEVCLLSPPHILQATAHSLTGLLWLLEKGSPQPSHNLCTGLPGMFPLSPFQPLSSWLILPHLSAPAMGTSQMLWVDFYPPQRCTHSCPLPGTSECDLIWRQVCRWCH